MTIALNGIGIGTGIAMGRSHILHREVPEVPEYRIEADQIEHEVERFQAAVQSSSRELKGIFAGIPDDTAQQVAEFIDAHLLMLQDAALVEAPIATIRSQSCNAEWALKKQCDLLCQIFDEMEDPYFRTRRNDVAHVVTGIQRQLLLSGEEDQPSDWAEHLHGHIVIADDLTPADIIVLNSQGIAGFVTEHGGPLSHSAILAKNLSIPAIVGVFAARQLLVENEPLIIDARNGTLHAESDEQTVDYFETRLENWARDQSTLLALTSKPTISLDGERVCLMSNIEMASEAQASVEAAADGVGLYRTEFLFMNRDAPPDEQEHYENYLAAIGELDGRPLTIRTLDLGADKPLPGDRSVATNPALGLRAIRLCLREPKLFVPQLRAALRASVHGPVRILLPMISTVREIEQARSLIEHIKARLKRQGHEFDADVPIGAMIEVPAAALSIRALEPHLDFMSIGTNDLIQYTLAIDRVDDEVTYLYEPTHPAVLRLIKDVIDAGHDAQKSVSVCGEMAADATLTRLLLGLGLREFSMHPSSIPEAKRTIRESHIGDLKPLTAQLMNTHDEFERRQLLDSLNAV